MTPARRLWAGLLAFSTALAAGVAVLSVGLVGFALLPSDSPSGPQYASLAPGEPLRVLAPSIDLDARVVPLQLTGAGVLQPPDDAAQVGWWDGSAQPGARAGQTVLTGHTLHDGGGSMDRLADLQPGQRVDVVTRAGRMRYEVDKVRTLSKEEVATEAGGLFGQETGRGRLVLVSCADWDGQVFQSNVIVVARALGRPVRGTARA